MELNGGIGSQKFDNNNIIKIMKNIYSLITEHNIFLLIFCLKNIYFNLNLRQSSYNLTHITIVDSSLTSFHINISQLSNYEL